MLRLAGTVAAAALVAACSTSDQAGQTWQTEEPLRAIDGQTWVVGSHLVTVPPEATVKGRPSVGSTVNVSGHRTARGELMIDAVEVVPSAAPTPAPTSINKTPARAPAPPPGRTKKEGHGEGD